MRKLHIVLIIFFACALAVIAQIAFGNFLSARLATLPLLRNLNLFNPRAPIVVTNRETVRVSDANDAVETANSIKSKLSIVVYYEGTGANSHLVLSGGALNWTADGYFVTTKSAMGVANKTYAVVLSNGDIYPIKEVFFDKSTNLALLATDARNLSTAEPIVGSDLRPGEKILLILNSLAQNKTTFLESYVRTYFNDVSGIEFNSDVDQRNISIQSVGSLTPGHAAVNLNGKLAGMWDGSNMISSDSIRAFANNFFSDNQQVVRPTYGFVYKQLAASEAKALQLSPGALITKITPNTPASTAGLQAGDIITAIEGEDFEEETLLSEILADATPGEVMTLEVMRNGNKVPILLTPKIME
jgi:serine protease Do